MRFICGLFICSVMLFSACTPNVDTPNVDTPDKKPPVVRKKGAEMPLLDRYMKELIVNPSTQDELDRNLIVNMLIDSLWDFNRTKSGIYYQIENSGEGTKPGLKNKVLCHYRGTLLNGREFDSSYKRNEPKEFQLNAVIAGWQEIIPLLQRGGRGVFIIPSSLAYGSKPLKGTIIKSNAILMYEVELIDFE